MSYFPIKRILLGAVIPVLIYYAGSKMGMRLEGAITASTWCIGLLAFHLLIRRELDGFSAIGATYAISELAGLLVTHNPDWYLYSTIVSDTVMGSVFLLSMLLTKPLIEVLAEQSAGRESFDEVRETPYYRPLWLRLSLAWGGAYLVKAGIEWTVLSTAPEAIYLTVRVLLDWPLTIALITFSFWYPKRYWTKALSSTN